MRPKRQHESWQTINLILFYQLTFQYYFVMLLVRCHANTMLVFPYLCPTKITNGIIAKDETVTNNTYMCLVPRTIFLVLCSLECLQVFLIKNLDWIFHCFHFYSVFVVGSSLLIISCALLYFIQSLASILPCIFFSGDSCALLCLIQSSSIKFLCFFFSGDFYTLFCFV